MNKYLGHKKLDNSRCYIQIDEQLFKEGNDNFITRVAHKVQEACAPIETGFEYIDGGKIVRMQK